ncbi:MAG TPA: hypothetical protein PLH96_01180 [Candidatus Paceibacterota bacterium]|nr:hypothetical protein [Candidatus Paceibacterota bacterium]
MTLTDEILFFLSNHPGNYKRLRQDLSHNRTFTEDERERQRFNRTILNTLHKLKKRGLVEGNSNSWKISQLGKKFLFHPKKLNLDKEKTSRPTTKKLIVMFDIPETKRVDRNWLRTQLRKIDFMMVQQSVWLGPAPLPQALVSALKDLGLLEYLKFFEVKEKDII